jgi:hypothetical protein
VASPRIEYDFVRGIAKVLTLEPTAGHLGIAVNDDGLIIGWPDSDEAPAAGGHDPGVGANRNDGGRNRGIDCVSTLFCNFRTGFSGYLAAGGNRNLTHGLNSVGVAMNIVLPYFSNLVWRPG